MTFRLTLIATFMEPLLASKDLDDTQKAQILLQQQETIQHYTTQYLHLVNVENKRLPTTPDTAFN